jgi:hypothetical protein
MIKRLMVCLCVAVGALWLVPSAMAIPCGKAIKKGKPPLAGTLLLRAEESTTELSFERDTDERKLIFVFDVKDCRLPVSSNPKVGVKIRSSELDVDKAFGRTQVESEGKILTVEVSVDPNEFDPGKHSAAITVRGVGISPTTAKVLIQRTAGIALPLFIFLACAVIGFLGALVVCGVAWDKSQSFFSRIVTPGKAAVAALVAAGAVWWASYALSEVWEVELETVGTLVIGALPAAYGAAIRILQVKKSD